MSTVDRAIPDAAAEGDPVLLPLLDDTAPRSEPAPAWKAQGIETLGGYAGGMRVDRVAVPSHRIHSVPSPWARALLFEQALFSPDHPAAAGIRAEWRGLLGVIALGHVLPLDLRVENVELPTLAPDSASADTVADLRGMAPDGALWGHLGLLYSGRTVLGGTSPYTLVFTGVRPVEAPIPFRTPDGRLADPGHWYADVHRDPHLLSVLAGWIETTRAALLAQISALRAWAGRRPAGPAAQPLDRADRIVALLEEWGLDVERRLSVMRVEPAMAAELLLSPFAEVFRSDRPEGVVYGALRPVVGSNAPHHHQLRFHAGPGYPAVILDPRRSGVVMGRSGEPFRGLLVLEQRFRTDVRDGKLDGSVGASQLGGPALDVATLFEPRLIGVAGASSRVHTLVGDDGSSFLLPLRREVLDWFTPEQVQQFTTLSGDRQTGFVARFTVPVGEGLGVQWSKQYAPTEVEGADRWATPRLAVWPDFVADRWTHYFYVVRLSAADEGANLRLEPIAARARPEPAEESAPPRGSARAAGQQLDRYGDRKEGVTWEEWDRPLTGWQGTAGLHTGLLLARPVEETHIREGQRWAVSIDFGSTHSRAFRSPHGASSANAIAPVTVRARGLPLLGDAGPLPVFFFLPPQFMPSEQGEAEVQSIVRFPLAVPVRDTDEAWLPSDGILFRQSLFGLASLSGVQTHLKWHERPEHEKAFQAAISHLYLAVAAEAAAQGATVATVRVAYPSVFPTTLQSQHSRLWELLASRYGFQLLRPASESEALQLFTAATHGQSGGGTGLLAVDIGGSTADLAVWKDGESAAFSSVRLAGSLVGSLVATDEAVRSVVQDAGRRLLRDRFPGWSDSRAPEAEQSREIIRLGFDELLRTLSRTPPRNSTFDLAVALAQDAAGRRLIAHAGYLYAVVAYLLGLMARRAGMELPHYDLHFAGHGSQFIRWLDVLTDGSGARIPETFFLAGLDAETARTVTVYEPTLPKEEVGRGLLLFRAEDAPRPITRDTFVGESDFRTASEPLGWDHPVRAAEVPDLLSQGIPELQQLQLLRRFINTFTAAAETRALSRALGLDPGTVNTGRLHNRIHDRLRMRESAWAAAGTRASLDPDRARLEPIVVIEAKALLEVLTGNMSLFDET